MVHIDMKGLPPTALHLVQIMPFLAHWGATHVLIEWEDMLPYEGSLSVLRSPNAYTASEVASVVAAAKESGMRLVPLVNTLSNVGFMLKHRNFAHLREEEHEPRLLAVGDPRALALCRAVIDQTVALMGGSDYVKMIHFGFADIKMPASSRSQLILDMNEPELILHHLTGLSQHVRQTHGMQLMVFDDIIRDWATAHLERLSDLDVHLAVWNYEPDLTGTPAVLRNYVWNNYRAIMAPGTLWATAAYRGADGESTTKDALVPLHRRLDNIKNWLKLAALNRLESVILMGYSRADHFSPLSEPLSAALPLLAVALRTLREGPLPAIEEHRTLASLGFTPPPDVVLLVMSASNGRGGGRSRNSGGGSGAGIDVSAKTSSSLPSSSSSSSAERSSVVFLQMSSTESLSNDAAVSSSSSPSVSTPSSSPSLPASSTSVSPTSVSPSSSISSTSVSPSSPGSSTGPAARLRALKPSTNGSTNASAQANLGANPGGSPNGSGSGSGSAVVSTNRASSTHHPFSSSSSSSSSSSTSQHHSVNSLVNPLVSAPLVYPFRPRDAKLRHVTTWIADVHNYRFPGGLGFRFTEQVQALRLAFNTLDAFALEASSEDLADPQWAVANERLTVLLQETVAFAMDTLSAFYFDSDIREILSAKVNYEHKISRQLLNG